VDNARGLLQRGAELALRGFAWWQVEVRRSRAVQYATVAVLIALIALLVWAAVPR
jgi:hypothetical protein